MWLFYRICKNSSLHSTDIFLFLHLSYIENKPLFTKRILHLHLMLLKTTDILEEKIVSFCDMQLKWFMPPPYRDVTPIIIQN